MPMPWTYRHSEREFRAFLSDLRERSGLESDNNAYTMADGVFQAFRRRLTPPQGVAFATMLPSTLRAIFVAGWDIEAPVQPFADRATLVAEVKALRRHHNLAPDNAIEATAWALRRSMDQARLDGFLASVSPEAVAFWHVEVENPEELEQKIR